MQTRSLQTSRRAPGAMAPDMSLARSWLGWGMVWLVVGFLPQAAGGEPTPPRPPLPRANIQPPPTKGAGGGSVSPAARRTSAEEIEFDLELEPPPGISPEPMRDFAPAHRYRPGGCFGFFRCEPGCVCPGDCCLSLCGRLWVRAEYLLGWTDPPDAPPLVTTGLVGTPANMAGVLGQPGTSVLYGGDDLSGSAQSGGRIAFGGWLDSCQCNGIEASYLGLAEGSETFLADSTQIPILARPFFDTQTGTQAAMLVAFPNLIRGSIAVESSNELQAVEVLWRRRLFSQPVRSIDFVLGYRFARLDETLRVDQFSEWIAAQGVIIPGTTKALFDLFETDNEFHGSQLGVVHQERFGRWSAEFVMKLAIGNMHSVATIDGATQTTVPGAGTATFAGGLLAQPTNIGTFERDQLAVMPELGVTLACDLTCRLRATVGYTFLYLSQVARASDQLDLNVSQLPPEPPTGANQPEFRFISGDFWAQGLRLGLDYRF